MVKIGKGPTFAPGTYQTLVGFFHSPRVTIVPEATDGPTFLHSFVFILASFFSSSRMRMTDWIAFTSKWNDYIFYLPRSLKFFLHHKWALSWLMLILLDGATAKRRLSSESGSMDSLVKGFFVSTLLSFQARNKGWSGVGRSHGNSIHHHQQRMERKKMRDIENKQKYLYQHFAKRRRRLQRQQQP